MEIEIKEVKEIPLESEPISLRYLSDDIVKTCRNIGIDSYIVHIKGYSIYAYNSSKNSVFMITLNIHNARG